MNPTKTEVSEIKSLINEGKDFRQVLKVYPDLAGGTYMNIKYGRHKYAGIEPLTKQEIKRIEKELNKKKVDEPKEPLNVDPPKKTYPRVIQMVIHDEAFENELRGWLTEKKQFFEKHLALTTLKIIALQTGDYSDLPPSALKDLDELKERIRRGEDILGDDLSNIA